MTEDLDKLKKIVKTLEGLPNKFSEADFPIEFETSELTSLCPFTGHPDFYTLKVRYKPYKFIVELKSVKLYIEKFRNLRTTHETLLNIIFEHFKSFLSPRYLFVELKVNVRGGVKTTICREESSNTSE
jgi:7-cyano-7-deazaguanine reductase